MPSHPVASGMATALRILHQSAFALYACGASSALLYVAGAFHKAAGNTPLLISANGRSGTTAAHRANPQENQNHVQMQKSGFGTGTGAAIARCRRHVRVIRGACSEAPPPTHPHRKTGHRLKTATAVQPRPQECKRRVSSTEAGAFLGVNYSTTTGSCMTFCGY